MKTKPNIYVFLSNTFISKARLNLAINQANAKQHYEAELLLFENYSHSSSHYHPNYFLRLLSGSQITIQEMYAENYCFQ